MLIGNQPAQCNKGMQNSSPATLWTLPPTSRYAKSSLGEAKKQRYARMAAAKPEPEPLDPLSTRLSS